MKKVFVGLSGGVDSGVSAALLKERGYDVTGVFIKIWQPEFIECTWREDRIDAMRVAVALGIPFREIDLSEEYKNEVISDMIEGYGSGETPNPDVLCNTTIKFGSLLRYALYEGADYLATGHYARIGRTKDRVQLQRGHDSSKDQSYFLYRVREEHLSRTIFPVGDIDKEKTRSIAASLFLPVSQKPDSQGLCFVGDITIPEFLSRYIPLSHGAVVNMASTIIGEHDGAAVYTIGQRHGFTVHTKESEGPYFIVAIDIKKNEIVVSSNREDAATTICSVRDVHAISDTLPLSMSAQLRYRQEPVPTTFEYVDAEHGIARFETPHIAAPGQSIVFYQGDVCLGGGIIERN